MNPRLRERLIRLAILAVSCVAGYLVYLATGSGWAFAGVLAIGLFGGPSLVGILRAAFLKLLDLLQPRPPAPVFTNDARR